MSAAQRIDPADKAASLDAEDAAILDFEAHWWRHQGAKESSIREEFSMSSTRYYQRLNRLLDSEAALAHNPMLVKRLRRMRSSRQRARSARRLGFD
ncbi:MAG TPA: DUF3263 domain-containing protein [Ornithinimicrobium sp.]|uniref:DUF3263 domain-containing protein n=1 Tax=Ornithinimicrobium sp. TaxID=1977084 RepID=UPI002B47AD31|nr:DUF3263 domain-containing protein [Ornithinimicrobium sp.]HKJ12177.1 DUF3263 domain-containing protein [Ornithinimicrobium sp.]